MKAMILAAGLGNRMRPLTDTLPKPLLQVGGKPLIQYPIERLRRAGVRDILINLAFRGEQIRDHLGDGGALGVNIDYSEEPFPLETGGAINAALDWLDADGCDHPFILVNGDVWSDFPFETLLATSLDSNCDGCLVMVDNPEFNPDGDFYLGDEGLLSAAGGQAMTYSGIALLRPSLVGLYPRRRQKFPLVELFRYSLEQGRLRGHAYPGQWWDIGTPERLNALDRLLVAEAVSGGSV